MRSRAASLAASALFLLVAPGTVAGYLPWLITRWRFSDGSPAPLQAAGLLLIAAGAAILIECFVRFAWSGMGTPAPVAPTRRLIVTGLYRHVRNPMYVAVFALIAGQALLLGSLPLLGYGAVVWTAFHLFVLHYEEPTLRRRFPEEYERFAGAVPRWLPRLRPWRHSSGMNSVRLACPAETGSSGGRFSSPRGDVR
jgi:protein-S-isoprenylcysteine O-methyltransferase Ste14